jgi:putative DNA primase/helicase
VPLSIGKGSTRSARPTGHNIKGSFVQPRTAGQAPCVVAHLREFHPVTDYLKNLARDGQPRLDTWVVVCLGAKNTPYIRAVGRRFLIGAIARILKPGRKADCAVILEGPQGTFKSTAVRALMPEASWFTDEIAELGTKDAALQLLGRWIVEWSELDSMTRSEVSRVKAYMSRASDNFRPPYEATVKAHPCSCCFIGTVNKDEYLRDQTGGRRFWQIGCGKIDIPALRCDRDQLWAEALACFTQADNWWLDTPELNTLAREEQAARREPDPWEPHIKRFVAGREEITVREILSTGACQCPNRAAGPALAKPRRYLP